jgi:mannosyl-oligosaccharide alpha-1,2-mannosidase
MPYLLDMKSMTGILDNLLFLSRTRNLLYVTDSFGNILPSRKFEHLSCFFPGLLALGADTLPDSIMSKQQRELHMWAAEGLAHTCWVMYADQPSGLGPEVVVFDSWARTGPEIPAQPNRPGEGWARELWMKHVRSWEQDGRKGGKPPGVGNAGMPVGFDEEAGPLDYSIQMPSYLLRPEVRTAY